ncbi:hypothetical protein QEH42_gp103 [Microbacterium phage Pumpernickel]|uniref:Uncharacterized protein n=1 Tax=Microbacterium phage Pumpernickel TaxID=2885983 RepID=A0AAE8Y734_9CAUD|nr:hypothetical protein QEH42_gp103 [Microbacterium phage Pumpernickel]UDL15894.1 hypothetical protein SEA_PUMPERNICKEL_103 [Microbacterium phage Pumpernickel]
MLYDIFALVLPMATEPAQDATGTFIGFLATSVLSASVVSAALGGLIQYLNNRRNARVTERKNATDAESDLVARYKEAASEERAQKESAVKTIRELLDASEEQVETLKGTVTTLNNTIDLMSSLANNQADVILKLTADRDKTQEALERAEARIEGQKQELLQRQQEILELTRSTAEAARIAAETLAPESN